MAAPTADNRQPWRYVVITDTTILKSIPRVLPNSYMTAKAPLAIVVCGVPEESMTEMGLSDYWIQDCSASSENIVMDTKRSTEKSFISGKLTIT